MIDDTDDLPFYFYPRPPRGGRQLASRPRCGCPRFLSTPSARRATLRRAENIHVLDISIHALREEGDTGTGQAGKMMDISIHALREEGDSRDG